MQKLLAQVRSRLFLLIVLQNSLVIIALLLLQRGDYFNQTIILAITAGLTVLLSLGVALMVTDLALKPLRVIWETVLRLTPGQHAVLATLKPEDLRVGRELVTTLSAQIYQLGDQAEQLSDSSAAKATARRTITAVRQLPVPVIGLDKQQNITFANEAAAAYIGKPLEEIMGANFDSVLNLSFSGDNTLSKWLADVGTRRAEESATWDRVRLTLADNTTKQFDLAAHYSKDNPDNLEATLAIFDHTALYSQDDNGIGFIALCVHELRTPLTLLRGYIEVFEKEFPTQSLTPELIDFMRKMNVSAQQLTAFVSNILNVARVESDQLTLSLQKSDWATVLTNTVNNLNLLAQVRGVSLECEVAKDLPEVGIDRVSIAEVINNLVDNAVKYSGSSTKVVIKSQLNSEGLIETTVQDWGVGIAESTVQNLFTKFYRNFRNRAHIGGTGLGLYLCKSIIAAHGGNIWVRSHEGQGTTIGFTLIPYAQLADSQKNGDNKEIVRGAHGWIKNHSLYRR